MKQLTRGMINCTALILFGASMCQGQTNGATLEMKGTVTRQIDGPPVTQNIDRVVSDKDIHSLVPQTVPLNSTDNPASNCVASDRISTDAYVLQAGAPTGCDPGDIYEGTITPNDGSSFFDSGDSSPSYRFDITTHYQCAPVSGGSCNFANPMTNTNRTISSGDSGFLTVTNNGSSTFTGTITLSGTPGKFASCAQFGNDSVNTTLSPNTNSEGPPSSGSTVVLALSSESSGCGGFFTGTVNAAEGPQTVPQGTGGTIHLLQNAPLTQDLTFPLGTKALPGETITDTLTFQDCGALNATLANGSTGNHPDFSGGSGVPAGTTFIPIAGNNCPVIMNKCAVPAPGPQPLDCKDIKVPKGSKITVFSKFDATDPPNPAYLIWSDVNPDYANISNLGHTFYVPGCIKPPCGGGGGSNGLNGREGIANLNVGSCQLLTYDFSQPAVRPGDDVQVTGTLQFCGFVVGEQTFFGVLFGTDTLRLEGPLGPSCDPNNIQIVPLASFPIVLWPGFNQPFSFKVDVPSNACTGTSLKVTSVISSGTVNYVVDGPAINVQ